MLHEIMSVHMYVDGVNTRACMRVYLRMYVCMYVRTFVGLYGRVEGWMEVCMYPCVIIWLHMLIGIEICKRISNPPLYVISHPLFSTRAPELRASRLDGTRRIQRELLQVAVRGRMQGEAR